MSDALLSPAVGGSFWAGSFGLITYCANRLKDRVDDRIVPLMGVLGAFVFSAQMINFTIPGTGSSGHISGAMLLAILLGPYAGFIVISSVLIIQCLFFGDGGLLALGCNIWNLGLYPCFVAYPLVYRPIAGTGASSRRIMIASVLGVVVGLELGAFSVVVQTVLSGRSELPFKAFVAAMLPIHLAIGLVEGLVTAGIINYVRKAMPGFLEGRSLSDMRGTMKGVVIAFAVMALLTGGVLSWFASTHPDGLEWSVERVYGERELPVDGGVITRWFRDIQEALTILPDYDIPADSGGQADTVEGYPSPDVGTSLSGVVGALMVGIVILFIGMGIRHRRLKG
jgi:cobalt/nickel transport system permease protein